MSQHDRDSRETKALVTRDVGHELLNEKFSTKARA